MPKGTNGVDTSQSRRKIVFTSFSPNVCTALNWKQPNCKFILPNIIEPFLHFANLDAVFFASHCGLSRDENPSGSTLVPDQVETDQRCSSVDAAVEFAKANNLLGVLVDGRLLVRCLFTWLF
jgi:CDK inhibitor PHO81